MNAARTCLGFTNNSARSMRGGFKRAAVLLGAGKAAGSCRSSREQPAPAGHGQDPPQLGQECLQPTEEEARWGKARCSTCQGHSAPFSLSIPAVPDTRLPLDEINGHSQLEWGTDTSTCPSPREFGVRNVRGVSKTSFLQSAFSFSVVFAVGK